MTDEPSDPQICLSEFTMAVPWGRSSPPRSVMQYAVMGMRMNATPTMRTRYRAATSATGVESEKNTNDAVPAMSSEKPTMPTSLPPKRSNRRPVTGFSSGMHSAPGSSVSPDCVAVNPWISCR